MLKGVIYGVLGAFEGVQEDFRELLRGLRSFLGSSGRFSKRGGDYCEVSVAFDSGCFTGSLEGVLGVSMAFHWVPGVFRGYSGGNMRSLGWLGF